MREREREREGEGEREREIEVCVDFTLITRRDLTAIEPKKNFVLNTFSFQIICFISWQFLTQQFQAIKNTKQFKTIKTLKGV